MIDNELDKKERVNPFFLPYNTPHDTVPFDRITLADYEEAEEETRRGLTAIKNMPFLHVEDALLGARRACSQTLSVTF